MSEIPKNYIKNQKFDAILIDDDDLVHMTWKFAAKKTQKTLLAFEFPNDFFKIQETLARSCPVYIDLNLRDGVSGIEVSKEVKAMGFSHIYITTGSHPSEITPPDWITATLGKEPPF